MMKDSFRTLPIALRYLRSAILVLFENWIDAGIVVAVVYSEIIDRFGIASFLYMMLSVLITLLLDRIMHRSLGWKEYCGALAIRLARTFPLLFSECFALMFLLSGHQLPWLTTLGLWGLILFLAGIRIIDSASRSQSKDSAIADL